MEDDKEWLQISDDDNDTDEDISISRTRLSLNIQQTQFDESYKFTASGKGLWLDGFNKTIKNNGLSSRLDIENNHKISLKDRLVIINNIGQGASGDVYKAFDLFTWKLFAVKRVSIDDKHKRRQLVKELVAYNDMIESKDEKKKSNLVGFYNAFVDSSEAYVGLVVEYISGGNLQQIIDWDGCVDESTLSCLSKQCLLGLQQIHEQNQIHRDIKPANLLVNRKGIVKIADFGISRVLESNDITNANNSIMTDHLQGEVVTEDGPSTRHKISNLPHATTFVGTLTYMSPERINGEPYDFYADIWSLGLSILSVALGKHPFQTLSYWSVISAIQDDNFPGTMDKEKRWSNEFLDFIGICLRKNPEERLGCSELLSHRFIQMHGSKHHSLPDDIFSAGKGDSEIEHIFNSIDEHLGDLFLKNDDKDDVVEKQNKYLCLKEKLDTLEDSSDWKEFSDQIDLDHDLVKEKCLVKISSIKSKLDRLIH